MPSTDAADQLADALLHLARGLVGEGDGEDLAAAGRGRCARMWAMRVVSTAGLAGAGAGQHQHRPVERLDRLALLRVQAVEIGRGAGAERTRGDAARGGLRAHRSGSLRFGSAILSGVGGFGRRNDSQ